MFQHLQQEPSFDCFRFQFHPVAKQVPRQTKASVLEEKRTVSEKESERIILCFGVAVDASTKRVTLSRTLSAEVRMHLFAFFNSLRLLFVPLVKKNDRWINIKTYR